MHELISKLVVSDAEKIKTGSNKMNSLGMKNLKFLSCLFGLTQTEIFLKRFEG